MTPIRLFLKDIIHSAPCTCPTCGGALRRIGEDVTETLDYLPGRFNCPAQVAGSAAWR
jgi:transposase